LLNAPFGFYRLTAAQAGRINCPGYLHHQLGRMTVENQLRGQLSQMRNMFMVFLILAIAFIAIGLRGPRSFIYVGIAFLIIALLKSRRSS
jgi:hypothetical protein